MEYNNCQRRSREALRTDCAPDCSGLEHLDRRGVNDLDAAPPPSLTRNAPYDEESASTMTAQPFYCLWNVLAIQPCYTLYNTSTVWLLPRQALHPLATVLVPFIEAILVGSFELVIFFTWFDGSAPGLLIAPWRETVLLTVVAVDQLATTVVDLAEFKLRLEESIKGCFTFAPNKNSQEIDQQ